MIDGTAIAEYLTAALGGAGDRLMNRSLDQGLSALSASVTRRLGQGPLDDLGANPDSIRTRERVATAIEEAAATDPDFERELADLRARIDRAGGEKIVARFGRDGRIVVRGDGNGHTAGGNVWAYDYYAPQPDDISGAPTWTKGCLWIGGAIAAFGWAMMLIMLSQQGAQSVPGPGFAIFAIGGLIMAAGELGARTSTPRRRR
ncbi:hypothetical protein [Nocardia goodfellowii]|uniref:DUF1707 domain-containing protein n=1 Tax=Nocardia goodfellowii TaxID=882446 RepID=A0ABS4QPS6_9NOCA|nr:hypothetical protein [Nocardia goodfellowii]MBP2193029.1 hypothetical protein [Nocardia goodfellowii]